MPQLSLVNGTRARGVGLAGIGVIIVAVLGGCGPDGPDADTASVADPVTADASPAPTTSEVEEALVADASDGSVPASGEVVGVRALDNTFIDEVIEIEPGTEVHWENRGRNDHDVVPVADTENWGIALEDFTPGDTYSHVFSTPGTYRYFCTVHGTADIGMVGTVIVR